MKYDVVCPLALKDVNSYYKSLNNLEKYVEVKKFVVIGNDEVKKEIEFRNDSRVTFVDESLLVTYSDVYDIISKRTKNDQSSLKRSGWYLQQFLKLSYSLICNDEYYILWDADTMPICKHEMIVDGHPVFDMKTEHNEPYFITFSRLFPNYVKRNPLSYISEHMIVRTEILKEMIKEIGESCLIGDVWYEKIINAINLEDIPHSGFADYETYGLYCLNKYPDLYKERSWDSLRPASRYFEYDKLRECDYEWIKKDYKAVSFEAGWKLNKIVNIICRNEFVQKHFSCKYLLERVLHQFTI